MVDLPAPVAFMLNSTANRIKARSIRSEREAGRLVGTGEWIYRKTNVLNFLEAAWKCREHTERG
jgi:hypothetical protein